MKALKFIVEIFRDFRWLLVRDTLLLVLEGLIGAVALVAVAPVIDVFLGSHPEQTSLISMHMASVLKAVGLPASLSGFLLVFLTLQILKNGFAMFVRHRLLETRYTVLRRLMVGTFEELFRAKWAFFSGNAQGTLLNTFLNEMGLVGGAIGVMSLFFANLIQFLFYVAVPLYVSWKVTSISLATAFVFTLPLLLLGKLSYRLGTIGTQLANQRSAVIQESLGMAKVVLGFGNERKSVHDLEKNFDAHSRVARRHLALQAATPLLNEPVGILTMVVTVFAGRRFGVPLSEIAVLLWALRKCIPLLGELTAQKNSLSNFVPSYEQVARLRRQAKELRQASGRVPFVGLKQGIIIERLTFAYPGHEPVLTDMTLRIPKGAMIAFVGESGAGKSTLIDLIMGFHEPTAGRIALDGVPLQQFDIHSYRQRIGYVPQDSTLFNMTIRDNLRWAKPDATDDDIIRACRQANADEFIERLLDGYDTLVGDRGVRLSGGQCQRVALARAILRKPELLILDEATSALDSHSERLIQQAIETVAKETTVIVVAHRLSTIANADVIYVLDGGRIVEAGTYAELVQKKGHFSRMTQLQILEAVA